MAGGRSPPLPIADQLPRQNQSALDRLALDQRNAGAGSKLTDPAGKGSPNKITGPEHAAGADHRNGAALPSKSANDSRGQLGEIVRRLPAKAPGRRVSCLRLFLNHGKQRRNLVRGQLHGRSFGDFFETKLAAERRRQARGFAPAVMRAQGGCDGFLPYVVTGTCVIKLIAPASRADDATPSVASEGY